MSEEIDNNQLSLITKALQIPGVKVNRKAFLLETLKVDSDKELLLLEKGPIESGLFTPDEIKKYAKKTCNNRKLQSTLASFVSGAPGGFVMAATIPLDTIQFWGFNLRIAQEVAYLYGYKDFWNSDGALNEDAVKGELLLFLATMLSVNGAASATRYLSIALAKNLATTLPKKALTKTVWYPIMKTLAGYIGVKLTKDTAAKSISKFVPLLGGVLSGGITYKAMGKMTDRLCETFHSVADSYTKEEQNYDIDNIKKEMPEVYEAIFREVP